MKKLIPIPLLFSCVIPICFANNSIGFDSVADALSSLKEKQGTSFRTYSGWTVVNYTEDNYFVLWSFTPKSHAAHPSAIKRVLIENGNRFFINSSTLCQAEQQACEQLKTQIRNSNNDIYKVMDGDLSG
ncbi:molecular chaperone DnaJ [Thalassotalea sp. HSM 43]|uniref:molecular chaperone DnaJ n=1 Tax=Thalassotalea sp. HSM 43 TaxID=2552945 RepID=UPI0010804B84|nr:molecular chaperone DnaJ [Thalassotalea sp. HSM 43]QBY03768.1 molecular chaperone DnaJ [Thalassotalea sp. HSM 43]